MKAITAVLSALYALDYFEINHIASHYGAVENLIDKSLVSHIHFSPDPASSFGDFDQTFLDPAQTTSEDFVKAVEDYAIRHQCLNHDLLDVINDGVYGDQTLGIVANFLSSYRGFTQNFCNFMEGCVSKMEMKDHIDLLLENIDEENGIYENDDIQMMIDLGLDAEALKGVSHKQLFGQCIRRLRKAASLPSVEKPKDFSTIAGSMVSAFYSACVDPRKSSPESSIAAMYFGSELLVSNLYRQLVGYLKSDRRLSRQDLAFFILHIDMDVNHARLMRLVVLDHCGTRTKRENIMNAVKEVLDARVSFYDKFVEAFGLIAPSRETIGAWGIPKKASSVYA